MKKYLLIAAIGCGFAHETGAMKREDFEALQRNALVIIDEAKEAHDLFFSLELKIDMDMGKFFGEQEQGLSRILQQENEFLKSQKEQLKNKKLSLNLDNWQVRRQFNEENRAVLADQSKFEQDCNELVCVLHKYRKAIDDGCKLGDAKKTNSTPISLKSFFSDRWIVAGIAYLTVCFLAISAWGYTKLAPRLKI